MHLEEALLIKQKYTCIIGMHALDTNEKIADILILPLENFNSFMALYGDCPGIPEALLLERFPSKDYVVRVLYNNGDMEEVYKFDYLLSSTITEHHVKSSHGGNIQKQATVMV